MMEGRSTQIVGERCGDRGIKEVAFGPVNPLKEPVFFSPPTNVSFGEGPRNRDPYEAASIIVKESTIPGTGDGLFAIR